MKNYCLIRDASGKVREHWMGKPLPANCAVLEKDLTFMEAWQKSRRVKKEADLNYAFGKKQ